MVELIPCKLMKQVGGSEKFLPLHAAGLCQMGVQVSSTVTARYYKGIGQHHDQMVMEVYESNGKAEDDGPKKSNN